MAGSYCDLANPNFTYSYCPSYGAAVLFAILFSFTSTGHVYQAVQHRKPFAAILIMAGLWEVMGYAIRTVSIHNPLKSGLYTAQMLLILLAPLWTNAFIYMLIGRMIHFFLEDDRIFRIKARKIALIFVAFDITAFLVQGTGGSMSSSTSPNTALTGLHIYTAGVALQILFNGFFLAVVGRFQKTITSVLGTTAVSQPDDQVISSDFQTATIHTSNLRSCVYLLRLVYLVIGLILFRNFYRLAEFAAGLNNTIIKHEWFGYVFDALPMLTAMVAMNVFHPGRKLQGPRCDFSEENRMRKLAKKEKKEQKMAAAQQGTDAEVAVKVPNVSSYEV